MLQSKSELRQLCLQNLARTNAQEKLQAGRIVAGALFPYIKTHLSNSRGVGLFKSFSDEINTAPLTQLLFEQGIKCFFPKTYPDNSMYFLDADTNLPVTSNEIAILIVPGLAFDRSGNRLGRGKGYYDRFLANVSQNQIFTIGIGMDFQLFTQIPIDSNDQSMNMIRTPSFEIIL